MDRKTKDVELFGEKLVLAERSVWDRVVTEKAFENVNLNSFETISEYTLNILFTGLKYNTIGYKRFWHIVENYKHWKHNKRIKKLVSLKNIMTLPFNVIDDLVWTMLAWEGADRPKKGEKPKVEKKKVSAIPLPKD